MYVYSVHVFVPVACLCLRMGYRLFLIAPCVLLVAKCCLKFALTWSNLYACIWESMQCDMVIHEFMTG